MDVIVISFYNFVMSVIFILYIFYYLTRVNRWQFNVYIMTISFFMIKQFIKGTYNNQHKQIMLPPINNRNSVPNRQTLLTNFNQAIKLQQQQTQHNTITLTHTHQNMSLNASRQRNNSRNNFFNRESLHINHIRQNINTRERQQHPVRIRLGQSAQNQLLGRINQVQDNNNRNKYNNFRVQMTRNIGSRNMQHQQRTHQQNNTNTNTNNGERYIVHFDAELGINNFTPIREPRQNSEMGRKTTVRLTKQQMSMLPVTSYSGMEVQCLICLDKIVIGDQVTYLVCFHFYHTTCCKKWMEKSVQCPICKIDVKQHLKSNHN